MAKKSSTHWNEDMLLVKGYTKSADGSYSPPALKSKFIQSLKGKREDVIDTPKQPVIHSIDFLVSKPLESFLEIHGVVAGLNGANGLMNAHWATIKKVKTLYRTIIRQHLMEGKVRKHEGSVKVRYIGYKVNFMDWDNFCSSFKHIGDSLVKEGIISDDNPKVIIEFLPQQIKCKNHTFQKSVVIIEDVQI